MLNVGSAHVGEFGGRRRRSRGAKGELVEAAAHGRGAQRRRPRSCSACAERTDRPVTTFGTGADADVRAADVELDDQGRASFRLETAAGSADVRLQVHGEHQVLERARDRRRGAAPAGSRPTSPGSPSCSSAATGAAAGAWRSIERPDGVTVVNDAYNANPESMRAALKTLAVMSRGKTPPHRRGARAHGRARRRRPRRRTWTSGASPCGSTSASSWSSGREAGGIHAGAVLEGSWGDESVHVARRRRRRRAAARASSRPATSCS